MLQAYLLKTKKVLGNRKPMRPNQRPAKLPTKVYGTPAEIQKTIKLLSDFKHIFSTELRTEPANIPPMEIPVDVEKWEAARANKLPPPRPQSILKQKETVRQIEIMKKHKVIRDSKACKSI